MKRSQLIAVLVSIAALAALASPAHARLYMMMHGSNVYPAVATPMPPMPAGPMMAAHMPGMPGRMLTPMSGGFPGPHVGVNVYPAVTSPMPHPDGPNLYQYVRSNPITRVDPSGLISWNEVKYCASGSFLRAACCTRAYKISQTIRDEHRKRYGDMQDNCVLNAIYHCVWQCKISHSICCGTHRAKRIGDSHEKYDGNPANNKRMDLHNNEIGRQVSKTTKDSWGDCYRGCEERVKDMWWFEACDLDKKKWNDHAKRIIGDNVPQNPTDGWQ